MKAISKSHSSWAWGLTILFFIVLAAITFRCVFEPNHVFSASDLNIGRLAAKKNVMPESLIGYYSANQVFGVAGSNFNLFHLLLASMPLELFANTFYGLVLLVGSLSMVWFLRIWRRSWFAAICGALVAFWFNSITMASIGHAYKMEVLAFSVLSLCLIEKSILATSIRRCIGYAIIAGLSVGVMMIEQQDVALLAGLFIGAYALVRLVLVSGRSVGRWFAMLAPIALVSLLLSGQTLIGSYKYNIAGAAALQKSPGKGGDDQKWNYITQWSMVPGEWPDLIAPGWSGWSTGNANGPYWGKIGQSAEWEATKQGFRNFRLDSIYMGIIPFLLAGFGFWGAVRNRKDEESKIILFWGVAGMIGLFLAFGKYSLLYKLFYHLPLVSNIRAPIKLLDNFQICLAIVAAFGLDRLLVEDKRSRPAKIFWISCLSIGVLALFAGLKLAAAPASRKEVFSEMGFAQVADMMVQNAATAWFHAAILALVCGALAFVVWKGLAKGKWILAVFIVVLAVDSLMLTSRYFKADDISSLKRGNVVTNFLKQNQGDDRTFFMDQQGIYNQWIASDGPYHGLNIFNIWQMPRMPLVYKEFLGEVGRNQIRLWQLSAVRYVAAPAQIMQQLKQNPELGRQFKPVLNYKVPTAQGMRSDAMLEFTGTIPRFALFQNWDSAPLEMHCGRLVSPQHNPETTVLVDDVFDLGANSGNGNFQTLNAETTKQTATIQVDAAIPSILRFSQRYQDNWSVQIDGAPADLLRIDYLSMGVHVPSGKHTVEFLCPKSTGKRLFVLAVFVASIIGAVVLLAWQNPNFLGAETER